MDILLFALEHPSHVANIPATVVLITGDRDYSYLISTLRLRGHDIVLIFPPNSTNPRLKDLASAVLDWRLDVVDCVNPSQHVQHLVPKTGSSFLPSPASSTLSMEVRQSRGGSVSSLELSRASPERSGSSVRGRPDSLSITRAPSVSEEFSVCDLGLDEKEDVESFVCIDDTDDTLSRTQSNADPEPVERPALTTSATDLFSSFFKRRQTVTIPSPPLPALANGKGSSSKPDPCSSPKPGDASPSASVKVASAASIAVQRRLAPEPTIAGPSSGWPHGSAKASLKENILQWSAWTTPGLGDPGCTGADRSPSQEVQSEYAESEICLDVFGVSKPTTVSQGIVNSTDSIQKRPASLSMGDVYNTNIEPTPARSSQPAGPVYTCESTTMYKIPPTAPPASNKQNASSTSTKVINKSPPAPSASKKQSGSSTTLTKVVSIPSQAPAPPASKKQSGSGTSSTKVVNTPPPVSKKQSGSSTASSTKGKSSVQSSAQPDARFTVLVEVLQLLRQKGNARPAWSSIGTLLFERDQKLYKKAGCSRMKQYLELASENGVITMGNVGTSEAWLKLNE